MTAPLTIIRTNLGQADANYLQNAKETRNAKNLINMASAGAKAQQDVQILQKVVIQISKKIKKNTKQKNSH